MMTVIRPRSGSIENRVSDDPSHRYSPSPTAPDGWDVEFHFIVISGP